MRRIVPIEEPLRRVVRLQCVMDTGVPRRVLQVRSSNRVGDVAAGAFLALYDHEFNRLVRIAYLTTGSNAIAEELVQEAFIDVLRRWDSIRDPPAYLRRALMNRSTSWLRRAILERRHAATIPRDDAVWPDEDTTAVMEAIRMLSPRQRAAVVLRYVDGLSEVEIAEVLHCRPGTVKSTLNRSRSILKEALAHED